MRNSERNQMLLNNITDEHYEGILTRICCDKIENNFDNYKEYITQKVNEEYYRVVNSKDSIEINPHTLTLEIKIRVQLDVIDIVENGGKEKRRDEKLKEILKNKHK